MYFIAAPSYWRAFTVLLASLVVLSVCFLSCKNPLADMFLPDPGNESGSAGKIKPVRVVANGPLETGQSLTANYDGTESVTFQWYKIDALGNSIPIPEDAGGNNAIYFPDTPGTYVAAVYPGGAPITPSSVPVSKSSPVIITGESLSMLTGTPLITGSGLPGEPLTASYTPGAGENPTFYNNYSVQWYKDGVPIDGETNPVYTPAEPGVYTASLRVPGNNPTAAPPVTVDAAGGLTLAITVVPATPALNSYAEVRLNGFKVTSGYTYYWYKPSGAGPLPGVPNASSPDSPKLDEEGMWTVEVTDISTGRTKKHLFNVVSSTALNLSGTVFIRGTGKPGEPLEAVYNDLGSGIAVVYQWYRNLAPITGETGTILASPADGYSYLVTVGAAGYRSMQSEIVYVTPTGGLGSVGSVTITPATPTVAKPVTASYSGGGVTYRWFNEGNWTPILVDSNTFTPLAIGNYIVWAVNITPQNDRIRELKFSVTLGTLSADPTIKGTGFPGDQMEAIYTGSELVTYQWFINDEPVPGATSKYFTPGTAGDEVFVRVSYPNYFDKDSPKETITNSGGLKGHITIKPNFPAPSFANLGNNITFSTVSTIGNLTVSLPTAGTGRTVTAAYAPESGDGTTFKYYWFAPGSAPASPNATSANEGVLSPTLTLGDWTLRVKSDTNSRTVDVIVMVQQSLTGTVTVTGSGKRGSPLTAGYAAGAGESGFTYEWYKRTATSPLTYASVSAAQTYTPTEDTAYIVVVRMDGRAPLPYSPPVNITTTGGLEVTGLTATPRNFNRASTATFTAGATSGPYTFTWVYPGTDGVARTQTTSGTTDTIPSLDALGNWTVIVEGANGRTKEFSFTVSRQNLTGTILITGSGETGKPLTAAYTPGPELTDSYTIEWLDAGDNVVGTGATFTPTTAGDYRARINAEPSYNLQTFPAIKVRSTGGLEGTLTINPEVPVPNELITATYLPAISGMTYRWETGGVTVQGPSTVNTYTPTATGTYTVVAIEPVTGREKILEFKVKAPRTGTLTITGSGKPGEELVADYDGSEGGPYDYQWYMESPPGSGTWVPILGANGFKFTPTTEGNYIVVVTSWDEDYAPLWYGGGKGIGVSTLGGLSGTLTVQGTASTGSSLTARLTSDTNHGPLTFEWIRPDGSVARTATVNNILVGTDYVYNDTIPRLDAVGMGSLMEGTWKVIVTGAGSRTREVSFTVTRTMHYVSFNPMGGDLSFMNPIEVKYGESILQSQAPTVNFPGYVLDNWSTSGTTNSPFNFGSTLITGNQTLYFMHRFDPDQTLAIGATGPGGGKVFYVADGKDGRPLGFDYYLGDVGNTKTKLYYLEAATDDSGLLSWGAVGTIVAAEQEIGTGRKNMLSILAADPTAPAALSINGQSIDNNSDWFLPSEDELLKLYAARGGLGITISDAARWSSTQSINTAEARSVSGAGVADDTGKNTALLVRPIRAF